FTFATAEAYDRTLAIRADDYATELLDLYIEKASKAGLDQLEKCIEYESPKVIIAKEIAKKFDADLIICGATVINDIENSLIGSVFESITRYATCDVLVIR